MFPPRWVTVRSLLSKRMNMTVHSLISAQNLFTTARTLLLNNLREFDRADIFENLAAGEKQFHHPGACGAG